MDYTLKVGKEGSSRLILLNEMVNSLSIDFIESTTQLKNKSILEVGCGIGLMSIELAEKSLPYGQVLATDISAEQLELAKSNSEKSAVKNIRFQQVSAFNLDQLHNTFDIIYMRFLLGHLPNTIEILQKTASLMHAESLLICEEIERIDNMYCDPADEAFDWWKKALDVQVKACKGNFTIGKELPDILSQNNFNIEKSTTVQPVLNSSRLKEQLWLGILEIRPLLILSGFATEEKIAEMILSLKRLSHSPVTTVGFFGLKQIVANKKTF